MNAVFFRLEVRYTQDGQDTMRRLGWAKSDVSRVAAQHAHNVPQGDSLILGLRGGLSLIIFRAEDLSSNVYVMSRAEADGCQARHAVRGVA